MCAFAQVTTRTFLIISIVFNFYTVRHVVEDGWIRSLAYDRVTQCLEVRFTWNAVTQFRPVPLAAVREIWKARPMNMALDKLVMKNRRIRFDQVRTEGKLLSSLLRGWA